MKKLKVPSLQHLARLWHPEPAGVQRALVNLAKNSPTFSYELLFELVHDLVLLRVPYEQIEFALNTRVHRPHVRSNFLEIMPLVRDHFAGVGAQFVHQVTRRYYPISRELAIPFSPSFVYGANGQLHLPWMSFWKSNPLSGEKLSLFMGVVDEVLSQDPDLDSARFAFLDFSAPVGLSARALSVNDGSEIPRVGAAELQEMLEIFSEGFRRAQIELAGLDATGDRKVDGNEDQPGLFE